MPGALRRRSVWHPESEALLHDAGEVHRHAEQQAAPRSRLLGKRRNLFDQRSAAERRRERHSALRPYDRRRMGRAAGSVLFPLAGSLHVHRLVVVRHRHARVQERVAVGHRRQPPSAIAAERRRSDSGVSQRRAGLGADLQHDAVVRRADQVRPRTVRPGLLDDEPIDAEPRSADGVLQHVHSAGRSAPGTVRAAARVRADLRSAELEGSVGSAPWRRVRPDGRREDRDQRSCRQIHDGVLDRRLRAGVQPAAAGDRSPQLDRHEPR